MDVRVKRRLKSIGHYNFKYYVVAIEGKPTIFQKEDFGRHKCISGKMASGIKKVAMGVLA